MLAAIAFTLAVAALCLHVKTWLEKMEAESATTARELWEDETRAMAIRWLARKREAKSKDRLGHGRRLK